MRNLKFIAEFTTNHVGNFNLLMKMVESAANTGCDFIKMQKKNVDTFYSKEKLNYPYLSLYGKTWGDYRRIFEFNKKQFDEFDLKCKEVGIKWFSTAQDISSLNFLLNYDLEMYKIASINAKNIQLLKELTKTVPKDKIIDISLAGCSLKEIEKVINTIPNHKLILNHCVAEYPCEYKNLRLGNISKLIEYFKDSRISIGYSGHEEGIIPTIAAVDLGVEYVERHFCLCRESFVHHIECSLEPEEFGELIIICKTEENLQSYYKKLTKESFKEDFGMSKQEKDFLIHNKYGKKYLHNK